jgi:ribosomal protein S18 acetylase RimI-like enzyme
MSSAEGSQTVEREAPAVAPAVCGLRIATADDVERLRTVLADAFFDDPMLSWLMPNDRTRRAQLRRYFGIELRHYALARGRVWATADLAGAALTLPPRAWRAPSRVTLLEGSAFLTHLIRASRVGAAMEWRHVRGAHYYVRDVGVLPSRQGQGLGSALLRPTLERCDREGVPAYLEASSERSAALYERLGFRITRELRIGGSPPLRLMLRDPQATRADAM